jgi:hypothetical protein
MSKTRQEQVQILDKCLEIYRQMRRFVEKQRADEEASWLVMRQAIGVCWLAADCPACSAFDVCDECPLDGHTPEGWLCCSGLWYKMDRCRTWGEFLVAMDKVGGFIRAKRDETERGLQQEGRR